MKAQICALMICAASSATTLASDYDAQFAVPVELSRQAISSIETHRAIKAYDAQFAQAVELSAAALAAIDNYYPTDQLAAAFDETPFGDTATSGVSQQEMYDLQFSVPVVQ